VVLKLLVICTAWNSYTNVCNPPPLPPIWRKEGKCNIPMLLQYKQTMITFTSVACTGLFWPETKYKYHPQITVFNGIAENTKENLWYSRQDLLGLLGVLVPQNEKRCFRKSYCTVILVHHISLLDTPHIKFPTPVANTLTGFKVKYTSVCYSISQPT
jgi:hypothetical protein